MRITRRAVATGHGITERDLARSKQWLQCRGRYDRERTRQVVENVEQLRAPQPQLEAPMASLDIFCRSRMALWLMAFTCGPM